MGLGKNKTTPESRAYWEFVEKTAAKARNDHTWQRGAVPPTPPPKGKDRDPAPDPSH
jgi:hypothetical protein